MNEVKSESQVALVEAAPQGGIARRRLLRAGMVAAPVVLTLSGRSAMAAKGDACAGLSPMAWNSLTVNGTAACEHTSHTVQSSALGKSPTYWGGLSLSGSANPKFKDIFTSFTRNQNRLATLLDTPETYESHFCAAYLNIESAKSLSQSYALGLLELQNLYNFKKFTGTSRVLSTDEIQAFLAQTWS